MKLLLQTVCETYTTPSGLSVHLETTQTGARWWATNQFGRNVFCGATVSRRSALIEIRKQMGYEIKLVGMSGARVNRFSV